MSTHARTHNANPIFEHRKPVCSGYAQDRTLSGSPQIAQSKARGLKGQRTGQVGEKKARKASPERAGAPSETPAEVTVREHNVLELFRQLRRIGRTDQVATALAPTHRQTFQQGAASVWPRSAKTLANLNEQLVGGPRQFSSSTQTFQARGKEGHLTYVGPTQEHPQKTSRRPRPDQG